MSARRRVALRPRQAVAALCARYGTGPGAALLTLGVLALAALCLPALVDWGLLRAVWRPDAAACAAPEAGACWGVIAEKGRLILFGRYPREAHAQALAATLMLAGLLAAGLALAGRAAWRGLALCWGVGIPLAGALLAGSPFGGVAVPAERWGGLPLTLLLTVATLAGALPLAVLLALARRAAWLPVRLAATLFIELVRGLPLIPVLFAAAFLLPLLLPGVLDADLPGRVLIALVVFAAAHLAEVVRGGLQSVPAAQYEAARALGFPPLLAMRVVILPQALRAALPALVNSIVALFKDVSLVTVVSLHELTGALQLALGGDAEWRPHFLEGYLFVGALYATGCALLSWWGRRVETAWGKGAA